MAHVIVTILAYVYYHLVLLILWTVVAACIYDEARHIVYRVICYISLCCISRFAVATDYHAFAAATGYHAIVGWPV